MESQVYLVPISNLCAVRVQTRVVLGTLGRAAYGAGSKGGSGGSHGGARNFIFTVPDRYGVVFQIISR
jgi:hypothetical protein